MDEKNCPEKVQINIRSSACNPRANDQTDSLLILKCLFHPAYYHSAYFRKLIS